ncbi:MAG: STAS domain-containing protein [Acidimicrobiia bacterium]|nr:STAS domain-containing protein [Acidimicrobiia bacterium]
MDELRIDSVIRDGVAAVTVAGEIDVANCREVLDALTNALTSATRIEVDLLDVTFMDSSGLSALIQAQSSARERGLDFTVVAASAFAEHVMSSAGLREHLMGLHAPEG